MEPKRVADENSSRNVFLELDDIYQELLLDHYHRPRHRKRLFDPDIQAEAHNVFCGDKVTVQLKLQDGKLSQVGFEGQGCSISQASASMMMVLLKNNSLGQAIALSKLFRDMMQGKDLTEEELKRLGELKVLSEIRRYPIRIKCALLPWTALEDGVKHKILEKH
ncbi:MAG: SUF system NifU family Fe-S cluster assembly protein [Chloroflexi bacterium]|nr:SUF system NifU family Fe-S cluster assembly protein [Chloroflexota bacterium]